MRPRSSLQLVVGTLVGLLALGSSACSSPGSQRIVGPDGSPMAHVHCGSDQGVCFRIAGELCPTGYDMTPVLSGNDGNFLVHCRAGGRPVVAAPCPTLPPAPASPGVLARQQSWPPTRSELLNPWPRPETNAAVGGDPGAPAAKDDVDIGY